MYKDIFLKKAKEFHNNFFDYSISEYINSRTKIKIKCPKHGVFEQLPSNHLRNKYACLQCLVEKKKKEKNEFIEKANLVHNNFYNYSKVEYKNNHTKVCIICPEHGEFWQEPQNHLRKHGCSKCMVNNHVKRDSFNNEIFIQKAKIIHGNQYDYSLINYINNYTKVKIICKKHGVFEQSLIQHINHKNGCPVCNESKGEKEIRKYLIKFKIKYIHEYKFKECYNKKLLSFDFYLPELNICIEYDGIQHFKIIEHFGGLKRLKETKKLDKIKTRFCKKNKIKLIRIKYTKFNKIKNIIDELNFLKYGIKF